jgi:hypothetical protein
MNFLVILNQEFLHSLVKEVYFRVDDCHKKPTDISYSLKEPAFGFEINIAIRTVIFSK